MEKEIRYEDRPWIKNYAEGVPDKINYESACLPQFLDRTTQLFPDKTALIFQGYKIKYQELSEMVDRFATCLYAFGIRKNDSVAILLPNTIQCIASYYAILKIGGIAVMNNPLYSDRELEHQFKDSEAKILITLDLLGNRMIDLRGKTKIKQIIYASIGDYLPFPKNILFKIFGKKKNLAADVKPAEDLYKWKDLLKKYEPDPPNIQISFDDVAMYQYTGGTTGISKGAMLTHGNLSKQIQQIASWLPTFGRGSEILLSALPFFHIMGLSATMNFPIYMGWTSVLVPKPQPEPLLETIATFKPTLAPLVPTMFIGMLNHPKISTVDFSCVKGFLSGSAPLPVEIIKSFEEKTGGVIAEAYGLTECSPATHMNPFEAGKQKVGSIGVPIPDTDCKIVSLDDRETIVPVGEVGELVVKGPQIMKGYRNMPDETAIVLKKGWFHTGDVAKMDKEGYFYIVDRIKDMVISGGYNVYPREVDEVFYQHPKVQEACAVGIPHPVRGEQIKVFVVIREGETATEKELIDYCKTKLATYKLPTSIEFRKELPKTNVGKVLRRALRDEEKSKGK